jgi:aspartyl/asparaginyl beta-hydroxylase (cupin superfamily)
MTDSDRRTHRREHSLIVSALMFAYTALLWAVLPARRYLPAEDFGELHGFEGAWTEVRDEYLALQVGQVPAIQEVEHGQRRLTDDERWRMYLLRLYGAPVERNLASCPTTAALLEGVPDLVTAFFSVLEPGKVLRLHPGPLKGVLRCHLPLQVPPGDVAIRVGREVRTWEEGRLLVFDDTYLHTAWNRSDAPRVVLFMDLVRPMPWRWLDRINRRAIARLGATRRVRAAVERAAAASATYAVDRTGPT